MERSSMSSEMSLPLRLQMWNTIEASAKQIGAKFGLVFHPNQSRLAILKGQCYQEQSPSPSPETVRSLL